jgi:hypothetical protein
MELAVVSRILFEELHIDYYVGLAAHISIECGK